MEQRLLKRLLLLVCFFFCLSCACSVYISTNAESIFVMQEDSKEEKDTGKHAENLLSSYAKLENTNQIQEKLGDIYVRIAKHNKQLLPVNLREDYLQKEIEINLYQMQRESIELKDMAIFYKGKSIQADGKKANDFSDRKQSRKWESLLKQWTISYSDSEDHRKQACIRVALDQIYGYEIYEDEEYVYIDCRRPKDVYKYVIVLDAGHGAKDTGSHACEGKWDEKDYNLDFVRKIEEAWDFKDCKLYVTRENDTRLTLNQRVDMANSLNADYFISIHCNSTDEIAGNGLEVLYKTNAYKEESKSLAKACIQDLAAVTGFTNRGLLDGQSIYIVRNAKMPMILLEMGFLTDKKDTIYLEKETNRQKMAEQLCKTLKKYIESK